MDNKSPVSASFTMGADPLRLDLANRPSRTIYMYSKLKSFLTQIC